MEFFESQDREGNKESILSSWNGYFTVEATLLMPVVFFLILFIINMGFFQYNRCMVDEDIKIAGLRASNRWMDSAGEIQEKLRKEQAAERKLVAASVPVRESKIDQTKMELVDTTSTRTLLPTAWLPGAVDAKWNIQIKNQIPRYNPTGFLRDCRKAEYLADKVFK